MLDAFDKDFFRQLHGERLVLAEITYRFPDHQRLLQTFVWQEYDDVPKLPRLFKFLEYWIDNIEGPLHSVRYSFPELIRVPDIPVRQIRLRLDL